jgi:glutathione S-transferase
MDPALATEVQGWIYAANTFSFGSFDDMLTYVGWILTAKADVLGDRFTAADIPVAGTLFWGLNVVGFVLSRPAFLEYLAHIEERPALLRDYAHAQTRSGRLKRNEQVS